MRVTTIVRDPEPPVVWYLPYRPRPCRPTHFVSWSSVADDDTNFPSDKVIPPYRDLEAGRCPTFRCDQIDAATVAMTRRENPPQHVL
ncbi:hypothetical protein VTI74DRAFT_2638 [Chaetomium olivicolor]